MIDVVVDTNVYVSALLFGGAPAQVLMLSEEDAFRICISSPIVRELRGVLTDKFGWSRKELAHALDPVISVAKTVTPRTTITASTNPDDNRILECAVAGKADAIVTGDKGLLSLGSIQDIPIVTPRQFLESKMWNR